jgi:hypothetical protein
MLVNHEDAILKALRSGVIGLPFRSLVDVCARLRGRAGTDAWSSEYTPVRKALASLKSRGLIRFNRALQAWIVTEELTGTAP